MKVYYNDSMFRKNSCELVVNFSYHADKRAFERGINKNKIRANIKKNLYSILELENNSDFKVYSLSDFMVIPGKVFYSKNKSRAYILIKTIFQAPKPLTHFGEKTIISA